MSDWVIIEQEEWGTAQVISDHLIRRGVSVQMIRHWASAGRVRRATVGRRVYYHLGDVKVAEEWARGRGRTRALLDRK